MTSSETAQRLLENRNRARTIISALLDARSHLGPFPELSDTAGHLTQALVHWRAYEAQVGDWVDRMSMDRVLAVTRVSEDTLKKRVDGNS